MRFRRVLCSLALLIAFACASGAQENAYRVEAFGSAGFSDYWVIFGSPIHGFNFGGGVGVRPFSSDRSPFLRMLGFEFEANGTRATVGNETRIQSYFTGNILFHATLGHVEPYLVLGAGGSHAGETRLAGDTGVGAKVFLSPRISLRPEFRVFSTEYLGSIIRGSMAVGVHW
jgi:hypothetical protein